MSRQRGSRKVSPEITEDVKKLIYDMVTRVVDNPGDVHVNVVPTSFRLIAELHTHEDDVGQVIGKRGAVVTSIRTILDAVGGKHRIGCELEYVTEREKDSRRQ